MAAVVAGFHLPANSTGSSCVRRNERPRLRPVPFPLPKKLGSDRLLLVSAALHETPTYKSISPELQKQRQCLKRPFRHEQRQQQQRQRHVHFRAVDRVHEYVQHYDQDDCPHLFFSSDEFIDIHNRDDADFAVCFQEMQHTKTILQLWGICSREITPTSSSALTNDNNDESKRQRAALVDKLFREVPIDNARGLEHRIITGIRNHRQKAVQSFLRDYREKDATDGNHEPTICPRYLRFSQTAGHFARALAEGDANVAQEIQAEA